MGKKVDKFEECGDQQFITRKENDMGQFAGVVLDAGEDNTADGVRGQRPAAECQLYVAPEPAGVSSL